MMSLKERKLRKLERKIEDIYQKERLSPPGPARLVRQARRWIYMLTAEIQKNDVTIRAESLSYFTLFSIMPLMAGVFLLLSFFSQWGPVQKEFEELLTRVMQAIPEEQRETLLNYLLQFKDQYLAKLSAKSTSIGFFALAVLIWIGGKVFFNIESMMNRIWAVKGDRPLLARVQNFLLCMVILPISYTAAVSLPGVIEHFGQKKVGIFLDQGIPLFLGFFSLSFIFRFFPNTRVSWKSAHFGALASGIGFWIGNAFLGFYFRMGTETAYGKAAVLPIFAFFIYVSWLIFILGIEVSLLCQHPERYTGKKFPPTTLSQALILERMIEIFQKRFQQSEGPATAADFSKELDVNPFDVDRILDFLRMKKVILESVDPHQEGVAIFSLAHQVTQEDLLKLIKDFLNLDLIAQNFDVFRLISTIKP